MENKDTGILLNAKDIKLHRKWFDQMVKLLGIMVLYREPKLGKHWDMYGELDTFYEPPRPVGCIFEEHPDQKTMKKLGWNAERQESTSLIHVPYDLPGLQAGALFIVPSALDKTEGRVFKVLDMRVGAVYPSEITCELGPVLANAQPQHEIKNFAQSNFNLLNVEDDD